MTTDFSTINWRKTKELKAEKLKVEEQKTEELKAEDLRWNAEDVA